MMPIWFLAWIIPLCATVAFVLFALIWAADDEDALRAGLYARQYREYVALRRDGAPRLTEIEAMLARHEDERKAALE